LYFEGWSIWSYSSKTYSFSLLPVTIANPTDFRFGEWGGMREEFLLGLIYFVLFLSSWSSIFLSSSLFLLDD